MKNQQRFWLIIIMLFSSIIYGQSNRVLVDVDWSSLSNNYKVEVYDPANNLLISICNDDDCYQGVGNASWYFATYDLGCLATDPLALPNYYIKVYDINDNGWAAGSSVVVNVAGVDVLTYDGMNASSTGFQVDFNVNNATVCTDPDSDGDGIIDLVDQDDDNDGILDASEGLGINDFNCDVPVLSFRNYVLDSGTAGSVGAIYRFDNSAQGLDILVEIIQIDPGVTLTAIDQNTAGIEDYLQTRLNFSGIGTLGIEFKFTVVDDNTNTPATSIVRVGGTSWDVDGRPNERESIRYYNPSAYGTDNPTTLTTDIYPDGAGVTGSYVDFPLFNDSPILRSYFQFDSNTFNIRMQLKNDINLTSPRLYAMSFTQCNIFDYKAPSLTIVNGEDTDGDGLFNSIDIDSDNDGIPDNVEAQTTSGYLQPTNVFDPVTGLDTAYSNGITLVDTDGDNIPDTIDEDSDNDGVLDIDENGMTNTVAVFADFDSDGLDDDFEGGNINDPSDVNDEIDNPSISILPDTDVDLALGGDLDYRDAIDVYIESASVDFDGIDDHIAEASFMGGWADATVMAWIKLDPTFSSTGDVAGQALMRMYVNGATNKLHSYYITSVGNSAYGSSSSTTLVTDQWYHVAISYEGASGMTKLYINGKLEQSGSIPSGTLSTNPTYADPDFNIGRHSRLDNSYFKGAVDEVRVFDIVLTDSQLQQIVHQEIEQDGATIKGAILDKDVMDVSTSATIPWTNLQAYYPMTNILTGKTTDASGYGRDADLKNIFTVQPQTAPMPYETISDGPWTTSGTWLHGNVWDITDVANNKDWSIVQIKNNVTTSDSHTQLGMLIDAGKSLTVTGDNLIANNWYLQLDGTLDLADDSQLIQTENSDLVTSATGQILRRQEGNADFYWYNYWSSPVGTLGATTLSDNNGSSNNTNNSPFNIDMLMDGTGSTAMEFTSAFDEVGKISDRWLYSFQNGLTYYDWVTLAVDDDIQPGVGYTQKGTGNAGTEQQYTFVGKPNNGTILISATDVPGDSANESEQDVTLTTTMIGNPYPSALDADEFIRDNIDFDNGGINPIIQGTILLWEQWAGTTHWLAEYEGGYGYINLTETARAYQHPDIVIADPTNPDNRGIKTPTKFLPVGQAFFVEVVNDGDIEFNNSQRIFKQEGLGEAVFFRETQTQEPIEEEEIVSRDGDTTATSRMNEMSILRLEFGVSSGASRSFVLGFSDFTTDGFDYGYDGGLITNPPADDMGSILDGDQYVIQAYAPITPEKEVSLIMHSSGNYTHTLRSTEITNIPEGQALFLRDNLTGNTYDLRSTEPYNFTSDSGTFTNRFEVVFTDPTLSVNDIVLDDVLVFVDNQQDKLMVKGLDQDAKSLTLTNMLGQTIKTFNNIENDDLENGIHIGELSSGVYLVNLMTNDNLKLNKKIILD